MSESQTFGWLGLQGWHGLTWTRVEIVGRTRSRVRIRATERTRLAGRGRWLDAGQTAIVPVGAIRSTRPENAE